MWIQMNYGQINQLLISSAMIKEFLLLSFDNKLPWRKLANNDNTIQ